MIDYQIEERFRRTVGYASLGMTNKYYKDGFWYKQNDKGYEGKSEYIATILLKHSNVKDYVQYEECMINGVPGCRSRNMLQAENQNLVTFSRMYNLMYGGDLKFKINTYARLDDRINYVLDFMYEATHLDLREYLGKVLKFDAVTFDVDRHFNNLAVIETSEGFREAPLFDFGGSFFSMQHVFTPEMSLQDKINKMTPQPFSASFEEQASFFQNVELCLDIREIQKEIKSQPQELQEIILCGLTKNHHLYKDERLKVKKKKSVQKSR